MSDEFSKLRKNTVVSTEGFSVEVKFAGGVIYRDHTAEVTIDTEWRAEPFGVLIYKVSSGHKGLTGKHPAQIDALFERVIRALLFMGYSVKVDEGGGRYLTFEQTK